MLPNLKFSVSLLLLLLLLTISKANKIQQIENEELNVEDNDFERKLDTAVELTEYDYEDSCKPVAEAEWNFIREPENLELFRQWVGITYYVYIKFIKLFYTYTYNK